MLVFFASLYPTSTHFTVIEALKKQGLFLLFKLNSPFPPTVTDCSGFTLTHQFSVLTKTALAFIRFSLIKEMAEGALFGVAKRILEKAGNLAHSEVALIWGVKDEISRLTYSVFTISAILMDAEAVKSPYKISQQSSITQTTKVASNAANTEVRSTSQASCVASNAAVADDRCVDQTTKAAAADDECTSQSTGIASRGLLSTAVLEMLEPIPDHDFFIQ